MNSIDKLNLLHPKIREAALQAYGEAVIATPTNVHPVIDQTYRSFEESDKLYQQGRTTPGEIVSNSKAGQSYHNYALALDFHLQIEGKDVWDVDHNWMIVVNIFKKHGFTWGGDFTGNFKDYPHLENKLGHNWRDLLTLYNAGNFISGTNYLNI
jgi:peptidoglycan L-alanyl-D-glutamate endopeptidase CwlK